MKTLFCSQDLAAGEEEGGGGGQEIGTLSCSVPDGPDEPEASKADFQCTDTTEDNSRIMSFFKTLVSSFLSSPAPTFNSTAPDCVHSNNKEYFTLLY